MNSFYFWSNKEPPTSLNTNSWFYLVDAAEQERIVRSIESRDQSRFCVLDSANVLYFWTHGRGRLPNRPLLSFIRRFERDHNAPQQFLSNRLFTAGK
jgi:hypothetical protein